MRQLRITDIRRDDCPFGDRLEDDDFHCNAAGINAVGYDLVGEDSSDFAMRLAEVNGVDFNDIAITTPVNPILPRYLPTIPSGSGKLFTEYTPDFVAVSLKDIVSAKKLKVVNDVHKMLGVPKKTKVILTGFGKDALIEPIWSVKDRARIVAEIASLDLYAVVPPNYSIWDDQPHAERLINEKRSLIMYRELLEAGANAIPHIYWFGRKDLDEWVKFLAANRGIRTASIDMQTLSRESDWLRAVDDLRYFASHIDSDMQFLVIGPSMPGRIKQILSILPSVTIVNSAAAQGAVRRRLLLEDLSRVLMLDVEKTDLMRTNDVILRELVEKAIGSTKLLPDSVIAGRLKLLKGFS